MNCPSNGKCPYSLKILPLGEEHANLRDHYVEEYCLKNYEACARYIVTIKLGENNKPKDLRPDQFDVAEFLVERLNPSWT